MKRKAFTVAEANALIPTLERVLGEIRKCMDAAAQCAESLQVLDVLWGEKLLAQDNPDHQEARELRREISERMAEIEGLVEREVQGRGLRFPQGGLEHGLIDFPTTYRGRWVFLCWHLGEPAIEAWHELDTGFRGRQDLTLEQSLEMGHDDGMSWIDDRLDR